MGSQTIADPTVIVPVPPTRLIGREREVGKVADLLRRDDLRLVTITGPGGVDKTHLALEVGHRVVPHFADGVVFVSLAAIRDPYLVLPTIANELGIREGPGEPVLSVLKDALGSGRMLIGLDTLEQIIAAASGERGESSFGFAQDKPDETRSYGFPRTGQPNGV